jgi:pimeloyl-ACP methyl ester carboxylesterase
VNRHLAGACIRRPRWLAGIAAALALLLVPLLTASSQAGTAGRATSRAAAARTTQAAATPVPYTTKTVLIGSQDLIGALYQPASPTPNESTALFLTHEDSNFIGSIPCVQLAQRGFTVLCVKSQYDDQAHVIWDQLALDVSASVSYLRGLSSVKKVVLVGYSGGGAIMSYYQNVAEHGLAACQAAARLDPCGSDLAGLPPADGVVILDGVPGIAFDRLIDLDASIVNESNLNVRNESLDMYNPANGYQPNGSSDYSQAFINRYTKAQGQREAKIVAEAEHLRKQVANGTAQFTDDAPLVVGRDVAEISEADLGVLYHTQNRYPVLSPAHPTGGSPQIVRSIRPVTASKSADESWASGAGDYTASSYLATAAIKAPNLHITADSISGVDWASTNTATVDNVRGITTPLLIMGMTASQDLDPVQQEMYYQNATGTTDKTLVYVDGATHGLTPCTNCKDSAATYGDTVSEIFNYMASWLNQRFGA